MADQPQLIDRPYRAYAAVRRTVGEGGFPEAVDRAFPVLRQWMATHGLQAAGPTRPFSPRLRRMGGRTLNRWVRCGSTVPGGSRRGREPASRRTWRPTHAAW